MERDVATFGVGLVPTVAQSWHTVQTIDKREIMQG